MAIRRIIRGSFAIGLLAAASVAVTAETPMVNPGPYPAPRYPQFLVNPSKDQLMAAARIAVRQTEGYSPLGRAQKGETVHVFLHYSQEMDVWEAIKAAWAERGVKAVAVMGWEEVGMTKEAYEARAKANLIKGADGWKEWGAFEPEYIRFFPKEIQDSFGQPLASFWRRKFHKALLEKNPDMQHVYANAGGGEGFWTLFVGKEHAHKFAGNWIYIDKANLLAKGREFPSDVWKMVDEEIVRPIPHVAEGTIHDPEGTRLHFTVTREQARIWDKESGLAAYSSGHLNIYPPVQDATWKEGVIRAAGNHTAFYPTMTVHLSEHGRVTRVEGGAKNGDMFRMMLEHPKFKNASFPSAPEPGYWYLTQDGLGTNPKEARNMHALVAGNIEMPNLIERRRAGVQHFSFASPAGIFGDIDKRDIAYAEQQGVPIRHTAHMHVYFPTVKWKLRDTGEWITLVDKGQVKAFENPEVRALAAKYGDPDVIFSYDWVPTIPGINAPGNYEKDYAPDPWRWISSMWEQMKNGTYAHFVKEYDMTNQ
jgi:hypothetical protein